MKYRPLGDNVVVRRLAAEDTYKGSIIVPEAHRERPIEAEVLAVGSQVLEVKVGARVIFARFTGTEIKSDDGEVLIIRAEDVLAVIEPS